MSLSSHLPAWPTLCLQMSTFIGEKSETWHSSASQQTPKVAWGVFIS